MVFWLSLQKSTRHVVGSFIDLSMQYYVASCNAWFGVEINLAIGCTLGFSYSFIFYIHHDSVATHGHCASFIIMNGESIIHNPKHARGNWNDEAADHGFLQKAEFQKKHADQIRYDSASPFGASRGKPRYSGRYWWEWSSVASGCLQQLLLACIALTDAEMSPVQCRWLAGHVWYMHCTLKCVSIKSSVQMFSREEERRFRLVLRIKRRGTTTK